jgi:DNA-binding IclR family transcriptional regulator
MEEGLKCVAAPIRNMSGAVVASAGILGPAFRLPERKLPAVAAEVVKAAEAISAELGFKEPASLRPGQGRKGAVG